MEGSEKVGVPVFYVPVFSAGQRNGSEPHRPAVEGAGIAADAVVDPQRPSAGRLSRMCVAVQAHDPLLLLFPLYHPMTTIGS